MRVRWTTSAVEDLIEIRAFLKERNPRAARGIARRIRARVREVGRFPFIGRPGRRPETRELVVTDTPYVVPYRIRDDVVEILRVLHATRRWPTRP